MTKSAAFGGVRDAVAGAVDQAAAEAEAMQLDMLLPGLRSTLTDTEKARVVQAVKHDRRGRPEGARNLTTRHMLDFVRKVFGDPVERRARWLQHTPESLALVLGCSKLEAFDRLDKIASELSRLFYAPMAAIDGQGNAVVPRLTMIVGGQTAPAADGSVEPPWIAHLRTVNANSQENQALPAPAAAVSHGSSANDPATD